jgi:hypothetical protein
MIITKTTMMAILIQWYDITRYIQWWNNNNAILLYKRCLKCNKCDHVCNIYIYTRAHIVWRNVLFSLEEYYPSRSRNPISGCSRVYDHETVLGVQKRCQRGQRRWDVRSRPCRSLYIVFAYDKYILYVMLTYVYCIILCKYHYIQYYYVNTTMYTCYVIQMFTFMLTCIFYMYL